MTEDVIRDRLVAFYAVYNPSCVNSVDAILSTYKGREEDLMKVLVAKYGPEPSSSTEDFKSVVTTTASEGGRPLQETPLEMLANRDTASSTPRERVERFYQHHNPNKIPDVPDILQAFHGKTENLIASLVKKYGPEPTETANSVSNNNNRLSAKGFVASSTSTVASSWNTRFHNFYAYYRPEKLSELPDKIRRHQGHEQQWMDRLIQKFGQEPPARRSRSDTLQLSSPPVDDSYIRSSGDTPAAPIRGSSLKSPSPPSHPIYQPILAQRFEHPVAISPARTKSDVPDMSDVINKLTEALNVKTREMIQLKGEKKRLEDANARLCDEGEARKAEIRSLQIDVEQGRQAVIHAESARDAALRDREEIAARIASQQHTLQPEVDRLSRALALREHQCRGLRTQTEQVQEEVELREKQLGELSASLRQLHQVNKELVDNNSALRLALVDPSSEMKFYRVVEEIQEAAQQLFDHRRKVLETEMQQYYEYAKQQIRQRDVTIAQQNEQLALMVGAADQQGARYVDGGSQAAERLALIASNPTERALAEEVASLKLQIMTQNEEMKALMLSSRSRSELPPPQNHAELEHLKGQVASLRDRLKRTEDDAHVAREALEAELRRQVEEMKDIHERVDSYEREKSHLMQTIQELKSVPGVVEQRPDGEVFTRSNMWSLLYER